MAMKVEPAHPSLAPVASTLIRMSMGPLCDYLFGLDDPREAQSVLARLFRRKRNRFSHQFAEVGTVHGTCVGLLIAYPFQVMEDLKIPTAFHLFQVMGPVTFTRFLARTIPLMRAPEGEAGTYFGSHLAIFPQYQGQGVGSFLLAHMETKARRLGFRQITFTVDVDNTRALALYQRRGYRIIERVSIEALRRRLGYSGYYRMIKTLS